MVQGSHQGDNFRKTFLAVRKLFSMVNSYPLDFRLWTFTFRLWTFNFQLYLLLLILSNSSSDLICFIISASKMLHSASSTS